jgi:hypothetical protein
LGTQKAVCRGKGPGGFRRTRQKENPETPMPAGLPAQIAPQWKLKIHKFLDSYYIKQLSVVKIREFIPETKMV